MPTKYRIRYSPAAAEQIHEIVDYIQRDSEVRATAMAARLVKAIESLEIFPHRYNYSRDAEGFGVGTRCMPVRPYLIRYKINEAAQAVNILSIRHGARRSSL